MQLGLQDSCELEYWRNTPMIFIFGIQPKRQAVEHGDFDCPICQQRTHYQLRTERPYISIFFLPIIPVGKPTKTLQCDQCHTVLPEKFLP